MFEVRRREFIGLLCGSAAWPLAARGEQSGRLPTIGMLWHVVSELPFDFFIFAEQGKPTALRLVAVAGMKHPDDSRSDLECHASISPCRGYENFIATRHLDDGRRSQVQTSPGITGARRSRRPDRASWGYPRS